MFKVQVVNNLPGVMNKLDMLSINIQSSVAEAVSGSESDIRSLLNQDSNYADVEIMPSVSGVDVNITNCYYDISDEVKEIIANKIKSKFGGNV